MMKNRTVNNSFWVFTIISAAIFMLMMILNTLTPYIADDFIYMYSFADAKPVTENGIMGIIPSMYWHSFWMNGRAIAHGIDQTFLLFPKWVFNLANSLVFLLLIYVIYRIINYRERRSCLLYIAVFCAVWLFTPVFGQVYLWQVGSANYLWGVMAALLFVSPFVYRFVHNRDIIKHSWQKVIFCLLSVIVGMYHEIPSFIVIIMAIALVILIAKMKKEAKLGWLITAIICAAIGYALLLMMPVELAAKQSQTGIRAYLDNFTRITELLRDKLLILMLAWAICFTVACIAKIAKERLILSGMFAVLGVAASYMMIVASYVPERCLLTTAIFGVIALGLLVPSLLKSGYKALPLCMGAVLAIMFIMSFSLGCVDILNSGLQVSEREAYIEECKTRGEKDISIKIITPKTEFSPFYGIADLQEGTSQTWPNTHMADYYGVGSIIGVK